jgi:hypothetical protein
MTSTGHDNDAGLAGFLAAWEAEIDRQLLAHHGWVVLGLTNFGERPVTTTRVAGVLGIPVSDADAVARQCSWPGTRVEDGIITVSPERARSATRRHLQIGNRRFGVTGCGPDIFLDAPLVRPGLRLEETCTVTGTPIRIVFTPGGVQSVEPGGAVVAMPPPDTRPRPRPLRTLRRGCRRRRGDHRARRRQHLRAVAPVLLRQGRSRSHHSVSRQPCLPHQAGVGTQLPPEVARQNVGPSGVRQLITGPLGRFRRPDMARWRCRRSLPLWTSPGRPRQR